jgi:nucleoside-diphosphate-sugar epimerase
MRILVTGATGFLGGRLCRWLAEAGHQVVGLGRNLDKGHELERAGVRFVQCDLSTAPDAALIEGIGAADAVVHAAALSSPWGSRADFMRANLTGTRSALEIARAAGAKRFVFISSPSVLFRFADQLDVSEDEAFPRPVNFYAESKQLAEREVLAAGDLSPIVLRPRAIYGPGDTALLPRLIRAAKAGPLPLLRGGEARTNLTYVDDVVRAIEAALAAPDALAGRVFNIAGEAVMLRRVVERAAAATGVAVRWRRLPWPLALGAARAIEDIARLRPGAPEPRVTAYGLGLLAFTHTLDVSAARAALGFEAAVSFEDGLARTFARKTVS